MVANPRRDVPFTKDQLLNQANVWFNKVIQARESMPRNFPVGSETPSPKMPDLVATTDDQYTPYGWDRVSDRAYVTAIWQLGVNQKVRSFKRRFLTLIQALGDELGAQQWIQRAIELSEEYKLDEEHKRFLKEKLVLEGKIEESKNPYYWG